MKIEDRTLAIDRRILEKFRLRLMIALSTRVLDARVSITEDWACRLIEARMIGYLWSEKLGVQEVEWPADWWEHLKQRWFPYSWLRRWPVLMTRRRFVARAIYPDYRALSPDQRMVFAMSPELIDQADEE